MAVSSVQSWIGDFIPNSMAYIGKELYPCPHPTVTTGISDSISRIRFFFREKKRNAPQIGFDFSEVQIWKKPWKAQDILWYYFQGFLLHWLPIMSEQSDSRSQSKTSCRILASVTRWWINSRIYPLIFDSRVLTILDNRLFHDFIMRTFGLRGLPNITLTFTWPLTQTTSSWC